MGERPSGRRADELRVVTLETAYVNGGLAVIIRVGGAVDTIVAMHAENGLITGIYVVRNPEKLSRVEEETAMAR